MERINSLIKNFKNGNFVHYAKSQTGEIYNTLKSRIGYLKRKGLTLEEKNNQMYAVYYYLNEISCNSAPAVVFDDMYIASVFNEFYKDRNDISRINKVVDLISSQIGISKPDVRLEFDERSQVDGYATQDNYIALINRNKVESGKAVGSFPIMLEVIAHELTHIQQFAEIKAYFQGEPVEPKYALMGLSFATHYYENDIERYGVLGALFNKISQPTNDYFYDAMEIDARAKACQYMINLVQNPYLCDGARKEIEKYLSLVSVNGYLLLSTAKRNLHLKNVNKKANLVLKNQIDYFSKRYDGADMLATFMKDYNDVLQTKDKVFEDLLKIEKETPSKIIEALNKSKQIRANKGRNL